MIVAHNVYGIIKDRVVVLKLGGLSVEAIAKMYNMHVLAVSDGFGYVLFKQTIMGEKHKELEELMIATELDRSMCKCTEDINTGRYCEVASGQK